MSPGGFEPHEVNVMRYQTTPQAQNGIISNNLFIKLTELSSNQVNWPRSQKLTQNQFF